MSVATRFNAAAPPKNRIVPYLDLSGGLDTVTDDHALARNQLSRSVNCWYPYGRSLGKRPGSISFAGGATGSGIPCTGIGSGRFGGLTYVIVQCGIHLYAARESDLTWTAIGTMSTGAGPICTAQMFEPNSGLDTVFIVNGVDHPLVWQGPGHTVVAASTLTTPNLPLNYLGTSIITPSIVTTYQNFLLYSGEPTKRTAVYVSNPEFPNNFTNAASLNPTGSDPNYNPYVVGANDGVNGGSITGLCTLEQGVVIFKESATYSFILTGLYNDVVFYPQIISRTIGTTATASIAPFDSYCCFLGLDGVYQAGITGGVKQISGRVATFFDSSLSGDPALITDRTLCVGVRHGGRYLLWFSSTTQSGILNADGMWFDFTKPDAQGMPTCGEINGMAPAGAVSLRSGFDDGNIVWCDSQFDRVGKFGVGFSDPNTNGVGFGAPITSIFVGKADFMDDIFSGIGVLKPKEIKKVWLALSLGGHMSLIDFDGSITFEFTWSGGLGQRVLSTSASVSANLTASNTTWGSSWGSLVWSGGATLNEPYVLIEADLPAGAQANNVQMMFVESSMNEWVVIGYLVEVLDRQVQQGSYEAV